MKKFIIIASTLSSLAGIGAGLLAAVQAQKPNIKETIVRIIAIKDAQNKYIADIIDNSILATPEGKNNAFTLANGSIQTRNVIESYYKATWKEHDAHEKTITQNAKDLKTKNKIIKAATGLTTEQIAQQGHKNGPTIAGLNVSLKIMLRLLSIEGLATILISFPYLLFIDLGLPAITIKPILRGVSLTSGFTKKTLYNNKKYNALKPLFDLINARLVNDWKTWNLNADTQKKWLGKAIWN